MKKKICLLLALLMVMTTAFGLTSCKKDGEGEETTVSTTVGGGDATGDPGSKDDPTLYEDLPTGNYEGYTFTFLNNTSGYANTTIVPTVTFDSINQAMFQRNSFVKDKLKIDIKEISMGYQEVSDEVRKLLNDPTPTYDAVYNEVVFQTPLAQSGAYYSVEECEDYLNFEKPWWFTDAMKSLQIDGRGFELFGDLQLMYYDSIWGMTFNQNILSDNKQAYPYELVRKGEWTIEALKDIVAATATEDTENWGVLSHKDFVSAMIVASDFVLVQQDEDDVLRKFENTETFVNVYNTIMNAFFQSNGEVEKVNYIVADYASEAYKSDFPNAKDEAWSFQSLFTKGQGSFMAGTIGDIQMVRAAEFNYGIIPLPKYSAEDQEEYVSWIYRGAASCGIPAQTAREDLERTCTILENLAAYSYKLVKYEYYDVVVQTRTVRDNDSIEMLDVIFGHHEEIPCTTRFEIDTVYETGISNVIRKEMSDRSTNIMSGFGDWREINAKIAQVIEGYKG